MTYNPLSPSRSPFCENSPNNYRIEAAVTLSKCNQAAGSRDPVPFSFCTRPFIGEDRGLQRTEEESGPDKKKTGQVRMSRDKREDGTRTKTGQERRRDKTEEDGTSQK